MSRNPRARSKENASPRRGGAAGASSSTKAGGKNHQGGGDLFSASQIAAVTASVEPETPAQMSERLRAERQITLTDLQQKSEDHATAESIGFSLAHEIGERACDLYIKTTYDEFANEYTALALWDEMMDSIGAFAQAIPGELPQNSNFGKGMYADPNAPTGMTRRLDVMGSTASMIASAIARLHNKLPDAPGVVPHSGDTPEKNNKQNSSNDGAGNNSSNNNNAEGTSSSTSKIVQAKPMGSAMKGSAASHKTETGDGHISKPSGDGEPKKERRRVRLTVTDPEEEKQKEDANNNNKKDDPKKPLTAREQLQLEVEKKLKEEKEQRELNILRSPLHAQIALADLKLDMAPPAEDDPTWIPDAPPPSMLCDLSARHAAGLKLKTVDPEQFASAIALNAGLNTSGSDGNNQLGNTSTIMGGTMMGMTGRAGRSMTLSGTSRESRRSMINGGTPPSGFGGRPTSGTVIGRTAGSSTQSQSQPARPLSPTQLTLNEVSKGSVPIHILTHHLSMMASKSPYVPRKESSTNKQNQNQQQQRSMMDGAPPDLGEGFHYGEQPGYSTAHAFGDEGTSMPPTGRANNNNNPFDPTDPDSGAFGGGAPPNITIPDAEDQQSSAFSSLEEDDDSHQSPSEIEVSQKIQTRQAQRTRNSTAFNTITNQLAEFSNPKSQTNLSSGGGSMMMGGGTSSSPHSAHHQLSNVAERNLIVDSRLGRVIPTTTVDTAGAGGKKGGGRKGVNPLTEAPRVSVQMPAPPPEAPPANSREARMARRAAALKSMHQQNAPTTTTSVSANASPEGTTAQQQQDQSQSTPPRQSARSYSPSYLSPNKKKKRRGNDPSNFFEPEAKVSPMIQLLNPTGGVVVKDDNGSRRNERPNQPAKLSREDYKKIQRMGPQSNAVAANLDFGWNNNKGGSTQASSPVSNSKSEDFSFKQQPQTARNATGSNVTSPTTATAAGSKTARK